MTEQELINIVEETPAPDLIDERAEGDKPATEEG